MSFLSDLFRPVTLHADHDDGHPGDLDDAPSTVVMPAGPLRVVGGGWLDPIADIVDPIKLVTIPTRRTQALVHEQVDGVCWHWTATAWGTGKTCAKRIAELPRIVKVKDPATGKITLQRERAASFHGAIESDGTYYQCAPTTVGTWHAGGATAHRFVYAFPGDAHAPACWVIAPAQTSRAVSANSWAYGTEIVNLGELRWVGGKLRAWPFTTSAPVVAKENGVYCGDGRTYHRITDAQAHTATEILRAMVAVNPRLTRESCSWEHSRIDPSRKTDSGFLWRSKYLPVVLKEVFR